MSNSWKYFVKCKKDEVRNNIKFTSENQNPTNTIIMKKMGEIWRGMTIEEKNFFIPENVPENYNKRWTTEDDTILLTKMDMGIETDQIADIFKRTLGSIRCRLLLLAINILIKEDPSDDPGCEIYLHELFHNRSPLPQQASFSDEVSPLKEHPSVELTGFATRDVPSEPLLSGSEALADENGVHTGSEALNLRAGPISPFGSGGSVPEKQNRKPKGFVRDRRKSDNISIDFNRSKTDGTSSVVKFTQLPISINSIIPVETIETVKHRIKKSPTIKNPTIKSPKVKLVPKVKNSPKKSRKLNDYQKFVKSEMVKKKYEGMKVTDRMIIISKLWNSDKIEIK